MTIPEAPIVIAIGGNAISKPGLRGEIQEQFHATRESMEHVVSLIKHGFHHILIAHGNGPQVGAAILRSEIASKTVYPLPMDICVADVQGGMGYMLQQILTNTLRKHGLKVPVVTMVTQVEIDIDDPAFSNPTKPIGRYYSEQEAKELIAARGWTMREIDEHGWRRVVPSPKPCRVLETESIQTLLEKGHVVIAGGGGGIPVGINRHNLYYGVEAVIDKDLTSALLATEIGAERFAILTGAKHVYLDYKGPNETPITDITAANLKKHLDQGLFPEGSMKPKIEAALQFLAAGGKEAIITSIPHCLDALQGKAGTRVR